MWLNITKTSKQPNQKVGGRPKHTVLQITHTGDQQSCEKMLNNFHYSKNANQSQNEISPHTSRNDHHQIMFKQ